MGNQIIDYTEGMKVGRGYNRLTGDVLGSPAVQGAISAVPGAAGQQVSMDCVTIQETKALHKSLGLSIEAGGSYMGFGGSAKFAYVNTCDFSSYSTYVMVKVSVRDAFESYDSPEFVPEAVELLANNNIDRFRARFGDCYIGGMRKGGEYFAIYQLTGTDESEREKLSLDVHAAFNGLVASAELNTSINNLTASSSSHLEVHVHVFRQGAIGEADWTVEDIMATAKQFPVAVAGANAFPYAVQLQDYAGLKSPNDAFNYYEIKQQQAVLEELAEKRFEFLTLRDDLRYILKNSDNFANADGSPVDRTALAANYDEVNRQINSMQKQAAACSRDASQCEFTPFDTSKFKLPNLAKKPEDDWAAKGKILAAADPLATALRNQQPPGQAQLGFDIGMGVAEGQWLPGPGKQRIHDALEEGLKKGFEVAVAYTLARNANLEMANKGAAIARLDPAVASARTKVADPFYTLGFDIGAGLFGESVLGGSGHTAEGPGSSGRRDALNPAGQQGFRAAVDLYLVQHHTKALA